MKVLMYNWVPFDNESGRGGGVTVYLKNIVDEILNGKNRNIELFFLSSGCYYDIYDDKVRYEEMPGRYAPVCRSFSIINSPVFSPAFLSFYSLDRVIRDQNMKDVFDNFLNEYGPFDVVHFHNLEGLSASVLECKQNHQKTKFIYTLHNYYPFCPQVNLWQAEICNCKCADTGAGCLNCMNEHVPADKLRHKMAMTYALAKKYSDRLAEAYRYCGRQLDIYYEKEEKRELSPDEKQRLEKSLVNYRKTFVKEINGNMDMILAVSRRVKEIAVAMGIQKDKVKVSYIGTRAADMALNHGNCNHGNDRLSIIYMGYRRTDKGYYFLTHVLNKIPKEVARKIDITLAAKELPGSRYNDVEIDKSKFHSFVLQDGYSREEIPVLLSNKNLGIIPVLWEDNLPQVAIEMTAFGVPVLASDLGGASELCDDGNFVFRGGDVDACIDKITYFVKYPEKLDDYWKHYKGLTKMKDHLEELMGYWS